MAKRVKRKNNTKKKTITGIVETLKTPVDLKKVAKETVQGIEAKKLNEARKLIAKNMQDSRAKCNNEIQVALQKYGFTLEIVPNHVLKLIPRK